MDTAPSPSQLKDIMVRLQQDYLVHIKAHIADFQRMEKLMRQGALPPADLQKLYRLSHDFAGSGTTFGFPDISRAARELHLCIKAAGDKPNVATFVDQTTAFVRALAEAMASDPQEAAAGLLLPEAQVPAIAEASSDVYFLTEENEQVKALAAQISYFGYNVIVNPKPDAARAALARGAAKAVVAFSDMSKNSAAVIQSVYGSTPRRSGRTIPLIIISPNGDFQARLAAARLGAQGFFVKDIDALKLTDRIEQLAYKFAEPPRYNIMIVDDDKMLTEFYNHALTQTGMTVMTLTDPQDAIDALNSQQIDLLLIDYSMPGCNGQELATIIRQHERYVSLPIVFISSYDDLERALTDTGLGIDDFLVKPFTSDNLFSVVRSRAQRAAELKLFMTRDSFSGLLNHMHFNENLASELTRVRRGKHDASYAMLDLDHFKSINDTHGHAAGDQVIKSISRMLQQHLRRSDIVGRCGGEEFGVIMPECPLDKAREILEKIRIAFSQAAYTFNGVTIHVTFSGGLVSVDPAHDLDHLMKSADAALYKAKKNGRNRIEFFTDTAA